MGDLIITREDFHLWSAEKITEWRIQNSDRWVRMILDGYYEKLPIPKPSNRQIMLLDVLIVNGQIYKHRSRHFKKPSSNLM